MDILLEENTFTKDNWKPLCKITDQKYKNNTNLRAFILMGKIRSYERVFGGGIF